ncbi:COG4 transport domain containing protein [Amanita muscaria]
MEEEVMKKNPRQLTSLTEIMACTSEHNTEEEDLTLSLSQLLTDRKPIVLVLEQVNSVASGLANVYTESHALNGTVGTTAGTAARIGQYVCAIDEKMGRVRDAAEHVAQTMELKASLHALQVSIENQDWEAATRHCARAMSVPQEIIFGLFAETVVPNASHHLPPPQMLQDSREQLLAIFIRNFQHASQTRDSAATSRFFKLFPAIGWEKEGLEVYSRFIVELIRVRISTGASAISSTYHTTALAMLLENIAIVVHQHQPIVDKYYGSGKMKPVLTTLLDECDDIIENLLEKWEREKFANLKLPELLEQTTRLLTLQSFHQETIPFDLRDLDKIVSDLAIMVCRWSLFKSFIASSINTTSGATQSNDHPTPFDLSSTKSNRLFERLETAYYVPLELRYLCSIIDKAYHLSESNRLEDPTITTTPDDVFYVLKVILKRLLPMGSLTATQQTLEGLRDVMDHKYLGLLKKKLDDTAGNLNTYRPDRPERESRISLIATLNDLDVSGSHLLQLVKDITDDSSLYQCYEHGQQTVAKQHVSSLGSLKGRLDSILKIGLELLFNQFLRPRLRNLIPEVFKDVSYVLNDEAYSTMEYREIIKKRFIRLWESALDGYKVRIFFSCHAEVSHQF